MSYTNAVFYLDYVNGSDAARTTLSGVVFDNPAGSTVRGTKVGHGLVTGAVGTVSGCTQAYANTAWKITRIDDDTFTLDGAIWTSFTGADVTGDFVRFGGMNWADAWKTLTNGATAARVASGDEIRVAKSPDTTSMGQSAQWSRVPDTQRGNAPTAAISITSSTNAMPIVITKANHGLVNGRVVKVSGHTTNTAANGVWVVANKTDNTFELEGSVGNGVGGATGTYQDVTPMCVVLTTPVTQTLCNCEDNWTAGTNVTSANASTETYKQFLKSIKVVTGAGHAGAGIVAKFGLAAPLDLSGYRQVSFWFYVGTTALANSGDMKLKLYSDAACTSEQESFDIPAMPSTARWVPITVNKGSALYNGIQGIALYANIAQPSKTYYIDNIIACKTVSSADSLNLTSLISKNTTSHGSTSATGYANEPWLPIQSIDGRVVVIDTQTNQLPFDGSHRGYMGAAETVALYKRETIKTAMVTTSTSVQATNEANMTINGGFNTSGPNTCDGETIFDGLNGCGYGLNMNNTTSITLTALSFYRYYYGINTSNGSSGNWNIPDIGGCSATGFNYDGSSGNPTLILALRNACNNSTGMTVGYNWQCAYLGHINSNISVGLSITGNSPSAYCTQILQASGNTTNISFASVTQYLHIAAIGECDHGITANITLNGGWNTIDSITTCRHSAGPGIIFDGAYQTQIRALTTISNNATYAFDMRGYGTENCVSGFTSESNGSGCATIASAAGTLNLFNCTINDTTKFVVGVGGTGTQMANIQCLNGNADLHYRAVQYGTIESQTTVRHTESGVAWLIQPSSGASAAHLPAMFPLAKVACEANKLVTVSMYMRRSDTKLTMGMFVRGNQLTGADFATDILAPITAAAGDWDNVTFAFTPTQKGVVEIKVYAYRNAVGGTYLGYIDDLAISQAA